MIYINPPPERKPPERFKITCAECGNEGFVRKVFKNGKVWFRCPGCGNSEVYEPNPT